MKIMAKYQMYDTNLFRSSDLYIFDGSKLKADDKANIIKDMYCFRNIIADKWRAVK